MTAHQRASTDGRQFFFKVVESARTELSPRPLSGSLDQSVLSQLRAGNESLARVDAAIGPSTTRRLCTQRLVLVRW
jgi:hypothetical protein